MKRIFPTLFLISLVGCAATPSSIVQKPTSVRPVASAPFVPADGAIFRVAAYHPLFEDGHARFVGDTITITVNETTTAVKSASSSGAKDGTFEFNSPAVLGLFKSLTNTDLKSSTGNSFSDKDDQTASNTFSASISVTVTEVLPNGNLVVSGEKQLALDKGIEYVRFSGVVNPGTISYGNTVASSSVADARIEYRSNSQIDRAGATAMLSRFFLSVLPF
jgi:flagellar L-ring protein precursor FlgH